MTHWVAAIADNIRNPLAGMAAALDIVARELDQRRQSGVCDETLVNDACQRMRRRFVSLNEYINELVDFGKPLVLSPRSMNLYDWLKTILDTETKEGHPEDSNLGILTVHRGRLSLYLEDGVQGAHVTWDAPRMGRAVRTLITNGIEAVVGQANPQVQVIVEEIRSGLSIQYAIHVDDNGPGFDPGLGDRVLEPFFSTKEAGTGLGLAIARKYTEAHGGVLSLGRAPSLRGARVTILMPSVVNGRISAESQ
jgi:signal transduction histidine kinase